MTIKELNGALEVCRQIQKKQEVMSTFDEDFYWEEMHKEEKAGCMIHPVFLDTSIFIVLLSDRRHVASTDTLSFSVSLKSS